MVVRQEDAAQRRGYHQEQQRPEEHAADNDSREWPLHLAADAMRERGGKQPDAGGQRSHQHRPHALLRATEHSLRNAHAGCA